MTTEVIIALGSNLGSPIENLVKGIEHLDSILDAPTRASSFWYSEPVNMEEKAAVFVNAVVLGQTHMSPFALLKKLEDIEMLMGRQKEQTRKKAYSLSRTIDMDIIAYGVERISTESLTIPHPRAMERLFVLLPLAQLCPEYHFPGQSLSLSELIEKAPKIEISDLGL